MSDTDAGNAAPGWWLASDGQWYPPHLASPPPPPPPPTPAGYYAPGSAPVPYVPVAAPGAHYIPVQAPRVPVNGLAIASMVLGIVWVYWVGSILAVIFGFVALSQIRKTGHNGRGMAIAGVVLGFVGVGLLLFVIVLAIVSSASGGS